jgi:hypothetical protein
LLTFLDYFQDVRQLFAWENPSITSAREGHAALNDCRGACSRKNSQKRLRSSLQGNFAATDRVAGLRRVSPIAQTLTANNSKVKVPCAPQCADIS